MKTQTKHRFVQSHKIDDSVWHYYCRIGSIIRYISLILSLLMIGCAEVRPWERGVLAKPHMATEPAPLPNLMREHNYSSREAGSSSSIGGGGGCGCY